MVKHSLFMLFLSLRLLRIEIQFSTAVVANLDAWEDIDHSTTNRLTGRQHANCCKPGKLQD